MERFCLSVFAGIAAVFAPIQALLLWVAIFVIADLVTGIAAAKKRKELLSSNKLRKTVDKLVWYSLAITLAFGLDEKVLVFVPMFLANGMAGICCGNELYSIFENAYTITGNRVFWILTQFTNKKINEVTGVETNEVHTGRSSKGKRAHA